MELIDADQVRERTPWAELIQAIGRASEEQTTVFTSAGFAVADLAAARLVLAGSR